MFGLHKIQLIISKYDAKENEIIEESTSYMSPKLASNQRKTTKIDYTLEQFLLEQKNARAVTRTLEKISNVLERLDKRISKLEGKR